MNLIRLDELVRRRFGNEPTTPGAALGRIESVRNRELRLKRWLPEQLVRRLSPTFARSNTVHPATAHALYVLTRALRPEVVFETGTYWGYATAYLAAAVADQGSGHVWTFDLHPAAGKYIPDFLRPQVDVLSGRPSIETLPEILERVQPQLFFQDSLHDYEGVLAELRLVAPRMPKGAVILFHDFVAEGVRRAARDGLTGWTLYQLDHEDPQQLGIALREPLDT